MAHTKAKPRALLVVPVGTSALADQALAPDIRRWLQRSRWRAAGSGELLQQAVSTTGVAPPADGLGALRLWGETGEPPRGWVCAADPVYLEARLQHLCLRSLREADLGRDEVAALFDHLQELLGAFEDCRFSCHGTRGYLRRMDPMPTASASPALAEGDRPGNFLPAGAHAETHDRLLSEVQMCLHEAAPNLWRRQAALLPVNSLWFWGGGMAAPVAQNTLPKLFADEPLFRGFWHAAGAVPNRLPDDPCDAEQALSEGFVAVLPEGCENRRLQVWLEFARQMLRRGRTSRVTLLFRDGMLAECHRRDRFRFWRGRANGRRGFSPR